MRVAVLGATGRVGRLVVAEVLAAPDLELAAAWAGPASVAAGAQVSGVPVTAPGVGRPDVVVDFSTDAALAGALPTFAGVPLVTGTTRLADPTRLLLAEHAAGAPVVSASNFALGVVLLRHLVRTAAEFLPSFDAEIVEIHHSGKRDAPSGTAVDLVAAVQAGRGGGAAVHGRFGADAARIPGEIGVHAVRGGGVVGEHTVLFLDAFERVELRHVATDRVMFARGALTVARRLVAFPSGSRSLEAVLGLGG